MLSSDRLKAFASLELGGDENDNWDSNFEGDLVTIKPPRKSIDQDYHELETIRPYRPKPTIITQNIKPKPQPSIKILPRKSSKSEPPKPKSPVKAQIQARVENRTAMVENRFFLPARPASLFREQSVEDYSDLHIENDNVFDRRLNLIKVGNSSNIPNSKWLIYDLQDDALSPKLFHPSDLTSLPRSANSPIVNINGSIRRNPTPRAEDQSMRRTRSSVEIQRYAEDEDDEDFSDVFPENPSSERAESEQGSEDGVGALMLHSKLSNNSWLGDEDDEDDPFASLEQGFDEMDLQANIARDKHARLCTLVEGLVSSLKVTEDDDTIADVAEQLVRLDHPSLETHNLHL